EDIDLIIIPGIAFDSFGVRIGYGKGYYDRAISKIDIKKRIGLAYDFQVVESIPIERYDERVGLIVTETGVIIC
ncbi:MAG: 5-formyltetrahydrofolate cyclo-ligase family protein, partial [Candidatus Dadabacteria bacterium]|nr:5-formyltetrahydrofolate cyclo-ligase family protein [Candidatus Dadabacteria bacterium]